MFLKTLYAVFVCITAINLTVSAKEYHVSKSGNDQNSGEVNSPFLTIQAAANVAKAGDIITVHEGVYRERVNPVRGGSADGNRIKYQAEKGEEVEIKGSVEIKDWENFKGTLWKATIPNALFGNYNPYKTLIQGDWFEDKGRIHHTGEVYLNGKSLWEVELLQKVLFPRTETTNWDPEGSRYTWFCESDKENTYIYANFHNADPKKELVEINVRNTCFYPDSTAINFITLRGFKMSQAATQWASPTTEQIGIIGTNWSKGWVIEDNVIRNSKCAGITLGKYGDQYDNTSQSSPEGYIQTIKRAFGRGWNKDSVGSHIVRRNSISDCEQVGICGSLGGIFSVIEDNNIFDIWTKRQFTGPEPAGIKIHAAIDMVIKGNRVTNTGKGIWLDWMAQGTRVTSNLCYNNDFQDLYVEVNHGPYLVDNNLLLSLCSVWDMSQGGAYVHNLIAGKLNMSPHKRETPYHLPHSTAIAGYHKIVGGDDRFVNNIFIADSESNINQPNPEAKIRLVYGKEYFGLKAYNQSALPVNSEENAYLFGAFPYEKETNSLELSYNPKLQIKKNENGIFISFEIDKTMTKMRNKLVTTELLGKTRISSQMFDNPDGLNITINTDFFGTKRDKFNPSVGPFEKIERGINKVKVWWLG